MKVIGKYPTLIMAELARSVLEAGGIPAFIPDSNVAAIDWRQGTAIGGVRLQVEEKNEEAARALLQGDAVVQDEPLMEEPRPEELCPHCGSSRVGREDYLRLKAWTMLVWPVIIYTFPEIFLSEKKVRCRDCGRKWSEEE